MGTDYAQRQRSKKRRKGTEVPEEKGDSERRRHKRRPAIRRLCKGMCYGDPSLTTDDARWSEDGAATFSEPLNAPYSQQNEDHREAAVEAHEAGRRTKRRKKQPSGSSQLSTEVKLIAPSLNANTAGTTAGRVEPDSRLGSLPEALQRAVREAGFAEPTPVQERPQRRCWPICVEGRDLFATAEPGSGKTLAYVMPLAPLFDRLRAERAAPAGAETLILVPTRELARQVASDCDVLRRLFGARCALIHGGAERDAQAASLSKNPSIIVATPGRLLDLADEGIADLGSVRCVVLDEADKMLSLGLQPQLGRLRRLLLPRKQPKPVGPVFAPPSRQRPQVLMFTATRTEAADAAAAKWLRRPAHVDASQGAGISRTVVQAVHVCAEHKKPQKLLRHLQSIQDQSKGLRNLPRVLVFANHIKTVRFLHQTVQDAGLRAALLHGERTQPEREEAMLAFRSGKAHVLVATDVAARGLHVRGLPFVVNYDFPPRIEQYVHRAGRTGRLATDGHVFSFFTRNLAPLARPLLELLEESQQSVDPNLVQLAEAYEVAVEKLSLAADVDGGTEAGPEASDREDQGAAAANEPVAEAATAVGGSAGAKKKRRQAVPGRLRKKLARERAAIGAADLDAG